MSKHEKYTRLKRQIGLCLAMGVALFSAAPMAFAATSVVANTTVPTGGHFVHGGDNTTGIVTNGTQVNVTQNQQNAVITWKDFSVGGSAVVNFDYTGKNNFNTLNYVTGNNISQIYGTINAVHDGYAGNIYIVNPSGVQIGNSAQINVGSLYVSNKYLNENQLANFSGTITPEMIDASKPADAELMGLGNINATNVTFEGDGRIVIDTERVKDVEGKEKLGYENIQIMTNVKNNIVVGYKAYDEENKTYKDANIGGDGNAIATVNGNAFYKNDGYMWVEDIEQLQKINTNLSGNYALRNSIDATSTEQNTFKPIGYDDTDKLVGFTGNFDGIDYNIFGLTIDGTNLSATGLFAEAIGANINNITLVGGKITGASHVGAIVGSAVNGTSISNSTNSAEVNGNAHVGGIAGFVDNSTLTDVINTGTITSKGGLNDNNEKVSNVGGLIGTLEGNSELEGNSYNLGNVYGAESNVGGLVGHAINSTIGDGTNLVYNVLDVTGAYNVGGIVGNMEGSTVRNAENRGTVEATSYTDGTYAYHTGEKNSANIPNEGTLNGDGTVTVKVNVANAGGIAGSSSDNSNIQNVINTGDVRSFGDNGVQMINGQQYDYVFYTAGNVGGVVGSAIDTDITNARNQENEIRGAHNVGGIAGYFGNSTDNSDSPTYTVDTGINDGGDIMATGARYNNFFINERVRPKNNSNESFIIGNIGGVVGYMDGDNVYVVSSANRGTVHSQDISQENAENVLDISKAANVGGIVGKLDRKDSESIEKVKNDILKAAVSNSYNTGDVRGYTGVGGVVGMMYNGEVASSYNLGYLRTTRIATNGNNIDAVNMGGIVGDSTEGSNARAVIYDVYNKGIIGDDTYTYYARHVAGIVGRLSGDVEKAYNNGEIYNGYTATGGIAGWMYEGSIKNAFNTGNITVYNHDTSTSQVGGIAGAVNVSAGDITLENVYNLGTLRSLKANQTQAGLSHAVGDNSVAGIVGAIMNNQHDLIIDGAYTTGNIYAGIENVIKNDEGVQITYSKDLSGATIDNLGTRTDGTFNNNLHIGSIYSENRGSNEKIADVSLENVYYIRPDTEHLGDTFTDLSSNDVNKNNANKAINYVDRDKTTEYQYTDDSNVQHSLIFTTQENGDVDGGSNIKATDENWRIYDGNTPILNTFLPNAEGYFSDDEHMNGIGSIQYGTAYDPLLTIIQAANGTNELQYNWADLGLSNAAGLAVYGAGLTLNDVVTSGGSGYFGGVLYSDGALNLNSTNDLGFGSAAELYGSSVNIQTDGELTIYGSVTATGNTANGATEDDNDTIEVDNPGNITIQAGDVTVYGQLTSAKGDQQFSIPGIEGTAVETWKPGTIDDPNESMMTIGDRFAHKVISSATGNITINAGTKEIPKEDGTTETVTIGTGNVNLYYGNKEEGLITAGGNLTVNATGNVYVDSDLSIGGNLALGSSGETSEVLLDITNIGQVQAKNDPTQDSLDYFHKFMHHFSDVNGDGNTITLTTASGDGKLAIDMWDYEANAYDLKKYDDPNQGGHELVVELNNLNITSNKITEEGPVLIADSARMLTYIWASTAEQLQGINNNGTNGLEYNYALKGDINASGLSGYVAIGTGSQNGFTGTFDGRGNRIIGLDATKKSDGSEQTLVNAGIFSQIGDSGTVKNVNIYSSSFTGTKTAGAVAGVNNGRIEGVVTFGNTVKSDGNAGGIAGVNSSGTFTSNEKGDDELTDGIYDVESTGSVIAGSENAVVGGLIGMNEGGLANSFSDSAVTVQNGVTLSSDVALGGVVGINKGDVQLVDSLGVTNGGTTGSSNIGGIIGVNNGNMYSGYNESIVSGQSKVGGIIGENKGTYENGTWNGGTVENVVNATKVTSNGSYVGGLVGTNTGSITNGRNNGTITGTQFVGGLVGDNANENSILTNLVNDSSAEILGVTYVGGIAGNNNGIITAKEQNLINRGSITGNKYVGGVAGLNTGTIMNTNNDVELHASGTNAQYFGGVVGQNGTDGTGGTQKNDGIIENATNTNTILAPDAEYVGGIAGWNTSEGQLIGMGNSNEGQVIGGSYVGGVIGKNDAVIGGKDKKQVGITNEGMVIATQGGAGGLIGENNAAITNTVITNRGEVHGNNKADDNSGTGGIIGVNKGDITYSSLMNEINGIVTGTHNVGGLIGVNEGNITGGRETVDDTDAGMYVNKIYNNGEIKVGTYTDDDQDGTYEFKQYTGSNISGLFGTNSGKVTAAYNTGAIVADGSMNVGGIAGTNEDSGVLDQVFSTVFNKDGTNGNISGGTNTGGLVGTNAGTLSNAYNTSTVNGNNIGTIVGSNTGEVKNVYSTIAGNLIGEGGNVNNGYIVTSEDKWKEHEEYSGFDFDSTDKDGTENIWKNYDGSGNPLLKVFLTKVSIDENDLPNLVYNTKDQDLDIGALTENGAFNAADDFMAYENNNSLIQNTNAEHKHAGEYSNWLSSSQIAASGEDDAFNPNNLGYDIDFTHTIDKAQITVDLSTVERTYGDTDITKGEYGFSYGFGNVTDSNAQNDLKAELDNNKVLSFGTVTPEDDKGLVENGAKTNDAGTHSWEGTVNLNAAYTGNYEFVLKNDQQGNLGVDGKSITTTGDSVVNKRQLSVSDVVATIIYGDQGGKGFTLNGGKLTGVNGEDGIVYEDDVTFSSSVTKDNINTNLIQGSEYATNKGNRDTADVDRYEDSFYYNGLTLSGDGAKNYELINNSVGGTIEVTQATLNVDLTDVERTYGSDKFNGNSYGAILNGANGVVNGDTYTADNLQVKGSNDGAVINQGNRITKDVGDYTYMGTVTSENEKLNQNYKIVVNNSQSQDNVGTGRSSIIKADLSISIGNVDTVYGTAFDETNYGYTLDQLVNGDNLQDIQTVIDRYIGGYNNTGAGTDNKATQDAGNDYVLSFKKDIVNSNILKNYNISGVTNGKATVSKKAITITANDQDIHVGEVPHYTGTVINGELVNGDSLSNKHHYGVKDSSIEGVEGTYNKVIGVWIGNQFYGLGTDWSNVEPFFKNLRCNL